MIEGRTKSGEKNRDHVAIINFPPTEGLPTLQSSRKLSTRFLGRLHSLIEEYSMGLLQDYQTPRMDDTKVTIPFPAPSKQVAGEVNRVKTDVMSMSFADKIMITITQNGRLAQWVCLIQDLETLFYADANGRLPCHCSVTIRLTRIHTSRLSVLTMMPCFHQPVSSRARFLGPVVRIARLWDSSMLHRLQVPSPPKRPTNLALSFLA